MARLIRIDSELVRRGLARSRDQAARLVTDGRVTPDGVVVHVQDVGDGFAVLAAAGVPTAGAQVRGVSLEDAFVQLTGKEIQR